MKMYFIAILLVTCSAQTDFTGFITTPNRICYNQNAFVLWEATLDECHQSCLDLDGCVSFEFFVSDPTYSGKSLCQPSTTCTLDQTVELTSRGELYFYELDPCADTSCSDGNMCNGEEYCDSSTGECVDGEEVECPNLFYCDADAQGCVRDCTTFAIDGYLRDCSAEFDANENELYSLDERVTGLEGDVVNIGSTVTSNTEGIGANADSIGVNEGAIAANAESITSLQESTAADATAFETYAAAAEERFAAIEDHLLALGPQVDQGEGTGESTASASVSGIVDLYVFKEYKGEWILFLAAINVILCICLMCQRYGGKGDKTRYAPVKMYSSAEENVQLRDVEN